MELVHCNFPFYSLCVSARFSRFLPFRPISVIHSHKHTNCIHIPPILYNIYTQIIIDIIMCINRCLLNLTIFSLVSSSILSVDMWCVFVCSLFYPNEHHSKIVSYLCHHHHHQHHLDHHHFISNKLGIVSFRIIAAFLLSFKLIGLNIRFDNNFPTLAAQSNSICGWVLWMGMCMSMFIFFCSDDQRSQSF